MFPAVMSAPRFPFLFFLLWFPLWLLRLSVFDCVSVLLFFLHVGVAFMCHSAKVPPGRGLGWEWVHDPIPRPRPPAVWTHCRGSANTYRLPTTGVARLCIPAHPHSRLPKEKHGCLPMFPGGSWAGGEDLHGPCVPRWPVSYSRPACIMGMN